MRMGVIQRQTFKNNLFAYAAVLVGAVSSIYIYPDDLEIKGYADALLKWALLIFPFMSLGMSVVVVRFVPYLAEDGMVASGRLLARALAVCTGSLVALALANLLVGDAIADWLASREYSIGKLATDRWTILLLVAGMAYASVLTAYLRSRHRIAIPAVFNNLLPKLGLPAIVLLYIYGGWSFEWFLGGLVGIYLLGAIGLLVYSWRQEGFTLRWGKLPLREKTTRDLYSLAGYSIFGSLGSVLALHLDTLSINTYIGDTETGVYTFAVFVVTIIAIPYRAVNGIAAPIVAKAWKEGDREQLGFLYRESAAVLFAVGGLIYTGAVVCLPYLYEVTDKTPQYAVGYTAAILLGAGQLFDQLTSINSTLISYSDYYRWNVVFILFMGGLNLLLNYVFIIQFDLGLSGAALATAISLLLFNVVKVIFIWLKMGILPFSLSLLLTAAVLAGCGLAGYYLPLPDGAKLNLIVRGGLITILFAAYLRFTNGVPALRRVLQLGGLRKMF